ncbi:hypothetical protein [Sinorhizobium meliloti]|uniref:hypothetical protein n=1 Tax=Rhizobium meliloti TaxID=382 RepID=UPI003F148225
MEKSGKNVKIEKAIPDGTEPLEICGIVMPISAIDGCEPEHWRNVLEILSEAVESAGFEPQLVSSSADIGVIQTRIVQNLYENPIVVCDVSGKNPNVMFELGLRLAFDKPVIIVKDDATSYSFDTSPIEHLEYRRDLRYQSVVDFKKALAAKINATVAKSREDKGYSPFLKHFGRFKVAELATQEVSSNEYLFKKMDELQKTVANMAALQRGRDRSVSQNNIERWTSARTASEALERKLRRELEQRAMKAIADELSQVPDESWSHETLDLQGIKSRLRLAQIPIEDERIEELVGEYIAAQLASR